MHYTRQPQLAFVHVLLLLLLPWLTAHNTLPGAATIHCVSLSYAGRPNVSSWHQAALPCRCVEADQHLTLLHGAINLALPQVTAQNIQKPLKLATVQVVLLLLLLP